jgi:hypothetical protein
MFRNQIRRGLREAKSGGDPVGLSRDGDTVVPTYCNDTVVNDPPAKTPELDKKLVRETGRRLAQSYLEAPPLMAAAASTPLSAEPDPEARISSKRTNFSSNAR